MKSISHQFNRISNYLIACVIGGALAMFSISGCSKDTPTTYPTPTPGGLAANASFTVHGEQTTGSEIVFTNTSQNYTSSQWTFGDGSTLNGVHVSHIYTETGVFNVKLRVANASTIDSTSQNITIYPSKLFIDSIVVDAFPFTDSTGNAWDLSSNPDLFVKFVGDVVLFESDQVVDISPSQLPVGFGLSSNNAMLDDNIAFHVELYDIDSTATSFSTTLIGSTDPVNIAQIVNSQGYITSIPFRNASGSIRVRLKLHWE